MFENWQKIQIFGEFYLMALISLIYNRSICGGCLFEKITTPYALVILF